MPKSNDSKTLAEWESQTGLFIRDDPPRQDKMFTREEFEAISFDAKIFVNYDERVGFLRVNGYEITRDNILDSSLPSKPKED